MKEIDLNKLRILDGELEMFSTTIHFELKAFEVYCSDGDKNLEDKETMHMMSKLSAPKGYQDWLSEHDEIVLFSMKNIHKRSQVLSLFAFFEAQLMIICDYIADYTKQKLKIKDLSGNSLIEQEWKYLTKVLDLNLEALNPIWSDIKDIQKIRNCIAHHNSNIMRENKPLAEQSLKKVIEGINKKKLGSIMIFDNGTMVIEDSTFLLKFGELQSNFFDGLLEILDKKYFQKK